MTAPAPRYFEIGPVVTVLHGSNDRLFCPLEQLYDVLGFLTGDVPMAEQIDDYIDTCRPNVADQYPDLAAVTPPKRATPEAEIVTWLVQLGAEHHAPLELTPLPDTRRAATEPEDH